MSQRRAFKCLTDSSLKVFYCSFKCLERTTQGPRKKMGSLFGKVVTKVPVGAEGKTMDWGRGEIQFNTFGSVDMTPLISRVSFPSYPACPSTFLQQENIVWRKFGYYFQQAEEPPDGDRSKQRENISSRKNSCHHMINRQVGHGWKPPIVRLLNQEWSVTKQ